MRIRTLRWLKIATLTSAGVIVLPAMVSGSPNQEDVAEPDDIAATEPVAMADDIVDQYSTVFVDVVQNAVSNSGDNLQITETVQENDTIQDADSTADGGEAFSDGVPVLDDGGEVDSNFIPFTLAEAGSGGIGTSGNDATADNISDGANSLSTGDASADNAVAAAVSQSHDNESANTAGAPAPGASNAVSSDSDSDDSDSDDSQSSAPAPGANASAGADVVQESVTDVVIDQNAEANSGNNVQETYTEQSNVTDQIGTSTADGGDATAAGSGDTEAIAGDGGDAAATNSSSSSNSGGGGNSISTGAASASNNSSVTVTQSGTNTSTNTAVVAETG